MTKYSATDRLLLFRTLVDPYYRYMQATAEVQGQDQVILLQTTRRRALKEAMQIGLSVGNRLVDNIFTTKPNNGLSSYIYLINNIKRHKDCSGYSMTYQHLEEKYDIELDNDRIIHMYRENEIENLQKLKEKFFVFV